MKARTPSRCVPLLQSTTTTTTTKLSSGSHFARNATMPIFNLRNNDNAAAAAADVVPPSSTTPTTTTNRASTPATSSNGNSVINSTTQTQNQSNQATSADESFPEIKGRVESKLMSMWHNVKYGWSGQIRANFSKEQPVWLLGRCYHPKFSPTSSMESSVEMTASMEHKLTISNNDSATVPSLHAHQQHQQHYHHPPATNATTTTINNAGACSDRLNPVLLPPVVVMDPMPPMTAAAAAAAAENTETAHIITEIAPSPDAQSIATDDIAAEALADADSCDEIGELATAAADRLAVRWEEGIDGFRRDFSSRLWMTYRREFPSLNGSNYTSDCGWGCMLRSGQMLLAQALIYHFLGRAWRWDPESQLHATHEDHIHRKIIRWFGDTPSKNSPFSIHTLVTIGQEAGKKAGDWYGPASVSHLLKKAVRLASQENADFDNLHVYVAQDCTVYIQDILDACLVPDPMQQRAQMPPWQTPDRKVPRMTSSAPTATATAAETSLVWKALVLLVPLRLGTEKLNTIYGNCLKTLLSTEHCIGIIGGRPKHSLYFVGFQEDKLIHLDPHYCQEMVDVNQDNFSPATFHCKSPRKLKLNKLDPSCCIGFYCQTRADFERFVATVQTYLLPVRLSPTPSIGSGSGGGGIMSNGCMSLSANARLQSVDLSSYPMFVFSRSRSVDHQQQSVDEQARLRTAVYGAQSPESTSSTNGSGSHHHADDDADETEEFVML